MVSSWLQSFLPPLKSRLIGRSLFRYGCSYFSRYICFKSSKALKRPSKSKKEKPRVESSLDLKQVEKVLGYSFNSRSLLRQAFTHSSYSRHSKSYERLEYVGDSVLNFLITTKQYSLYPDLPPGCLSPLRAANVDTEKLARVAVKHDFHKYLRHGMPILSKHIRTFLFCLPKYPLHSHGLIVAPKVLADVVESTIGAVFIDSNSSLDTTWEVTRSLLDPIITPGMLQTNPVTKLFEICQRHKLQVKIVDLWEEEGTCEVFVDNQLRGRGTCRGKKDIALNRAANAAYEDVVRNLGTS